MSSFCTCRFRLIFLAHGIEKSYAQLLPSMLYAIEPFRVHLKLGAVLLMKLNCNFWAKTFCSHICALHQWFGEIDPGFIVCREIAENFCFYFPIIFQLFATNKKSFFHLIFLYQKILIIYPKMKTRFLWIIFRK